MFHWIWRNSEKITSVLTLAIAIFTIYGASNKYDNHKAITAINYHIDEFKRKKASLQKLGLPCSIFVKTPILMELRSLLININVHATAGDLTENDMLGFNIRLASTYNSFESYANKINKFNSYCDGNLFDSKDEKANLFFYNTLWKDMPSLAKNLLNGYEALNCVNYNIDCRFSDHRHQFQHEKTT